MATTGGTGRMPRARCAAPGCTNFARGRTAFCAVHKAMSRPDGETASRHGPESTPETFAERAAREEAERRRAAAAAFRERMESGAYRDLFGDRLGPLMEQAASEAGVGDELGALRFVLARLLAEEDDPVTLAKAVARVASVSIQAARAQRAINGQLAEGLTDAITQILSEFENGA